MSFKRFGELYTGSKIPLVGLGTWRSEPELVGNSVKVALETGYRHIDCAWIYQNEKEVGDAIKSSKVPRKEMFITSKLWNTFHHPERVEKALDESLNNLQLEYLDLYLIHWPVSQPSGEGFTPKNEDGTLKIETSYNLTDTWKILEAMVKKGKVKHIGLSNFNISRIKEILEVATIKPAALQVELHPYLPQHDLLEFCKKENIHVTAYSPLGSTGQPSVLADEKIGEIAEKLKKTPAQIVLTWGQLRGCSVIPKSVKDYRIKDNFKDIELNSNELDIISNLGKNHRFATIMPGLFD